MLKQTVRCRPGMNIVDLTGRDDHITQSLTVQIVSHMNHHAVGQFDPHAAAMV
jgi:hypothetical protein